MNLGQGMYLPKVDSSSTGEYRFHQIPTEFKTSNSSNSTFSNSPLEQYHYLLTRYDELEKRVSELEQNAQKTNCFLEQSIILQRVCLIIIFLFPLIASGIAAVAVFFLSTNPELVLYAKWYLGILGLSGVVDLIYIFVSSKVVKDDLAILEKRIGEVEKKI